MKKNLVATTACALALVAALGGAAIVATPRAALANDGSESATVARGSHYEGEPVTINPGNGGKDVYAEWHMVDGEWVATFVTYNGNEVVARPEANELGWTFWVSDNGTSVQVVRTAEEGAGASTQSHWQEVYGVKRY